MAKKGPQKGPKKGQKGAKKGPFCAVLGIPKKGKKWPFLGPCGAKSRGSGGAPPTHLILLRNQRPRRASRPPAPTGRPGGAEGAGEGGWGFSGLDKGGASPWGGRSGSCSWR